jgi:hypothetical protein
MNYRIAGQRLSYEPAVPRAGSILRKGTITNATQETMEGLRTSTVAERKQTKTPWEIPGYRASQDRKGRTKEPVTMQVVEE